jgi:hypothetical protein
MKLLPEGKSRALSAGALAAAAACAVMALKAGGDLLTLLEVFSTPAFYLSLARSTLPVQMPPLAGFLARHMRLFFVFSVLFWASGLALALGLWARREWGRRGAYLMLYLLAAAGLLLLLFPGLVVPGPLEYGGVSLAPEFNAAVKLAARLLRLGAFVGGGLCLWGALALDRGPVKSEFI